MTGRTGRRPGNPDTRGHILDVALKLFTRDGFEKTSIRGVAREAEVDPALIHRYFGDKKGLLIAAVKMSFDPLEVIDRVAAGGTDNLAWRIVDTWSRGWERLGPGFYAMIREVPGLMPLIVGFLNTVLVDVATRLLDLPPAEARIRVALLESQVVGFGYARYITALPGVADLPREEFVQLMVPYVHRALFADLGPALQRGPRKKSSLGAR